ncbi:hypothetical protein GF1_17010 [Desulfolithobacter dissulfuricans]|uniref:Uncharacterized protein n=2 Tax=Desulfolithobacter dissulfuricans TaxID=2795293 RepID=A0A915XIM1_9BACT|nr:hypothetical protein GF1_17010 [Desulfolithobacter dissulfuricans]
MLSDTVASSLEDWDPVAESSPETDLDLLGGVVMALSGNDNRKMTTCANPNLTTLSFG